MSKMIELLNVLLTSNITYSIDNKNKILTLTTKIEAEDLFKIYNECKKFNYKLQPAML